ncbi:MAG TPA: hypothetical protein VFX15_15555 [Actinomycetes bacterium]|nr:hypothetical protein [Actinomycetes bacterium]
MLKHRGRASFSTKIREFIRQHEALTRVSQAQEAPAKPEVTLIDWPPATQVRITREAREAISREISYRTTRERECVETGGYLIADKSRYGLIIQATGPGDDSFHTPDMVSIGGPEEAERIVARDRFRLEIVGRWHNDPTPLGCTRRTSNVSPDRTSPAGSPASMPAAATSTCSSSRDTTA